MLKAFSKLALVLILLTCAAAAAVYRPHVIRSNDMAPALMAGDLAVIKRFAYGIEDPPCGLDICAELKAQLDAEPQLGDVVFFAHPVTDDLVAMRITGLPGDTIEIKEGVLYINGSEQPQTEFSYRLDTFTPQGPDQILPNCSNAPAEPGGRCEQNQILETLGDKRPHILFDVADVPERSNTGKYIVPKGFYFMLGDNRDVAIDSRIRRSDGGLGFIQFESFLGRIDTVVFSSAGESLFDFGSWRGNRYLWVVR